MFSWLFTNRFIGFYLICRKLPNPSQNSIILTLFSCSALWKNWVVNNHKWTPIPTQLIIVVNNCKNEFDKKKWLNLIFGSIKAFYVVNNGITLINADETVKAILVAWEYLTQTTLFGWPPRLSTSSFRQRSQTLTVRS